jgi:DNA polymerase-3 subunit delta
MKLSIAQLEHHLQHDLKPVYLIFGDEPFQLQEAADWVRSSAKSNGYAERELMFAELDFDWTAFLGACNNLSLFAQRRLIDLRLAKGKLQNEASQALLAYAKRPPEDTLLLIQAGKFDRAVMNSTWFKALEQVGVVVQVWPLSESQTVAWIAKRLRSRGLVPSPDAISTLAARVKGNLLAASQEIEKLCLLHEQGPLDVKAVLDAVADSARFSIFDLADSALAGESARAVKILWGLRAEDIKPPLVLWALTTEVRTLLSMSYQLTHGESIIQLTRAVWPKRKPLIQSALSRHAYPNWCMLLRRCARVDRMIKGLDKDREWDELLQLTLGICGLPMMDTI